MNVIEHTTLAPRDGLLSTSVPNPASSRSFSALTAPLFPLSRKRFAAKSALRWRVFSWEKEAAQIGLVELGCYSLVRELHDT